MRSPEAPKTTSAHGGALRPPSGIGRRGFRSGRGFAGVRPPPWPTSAAADSLRNWWPPNWLRRAAMIRAANESGWRDENRANSDAVITGAGTVRLDGFLDRPAPFAGVVDVALDRRRTRPRRPAPARPGRAATSARPSRGATTSAIWWRSRSNSGGRVEQREALGVGLQHAVLDAVVDHLHVVTRAGRPDVRVAVLGAQGRVKIGSSRSTAAASPPTIRQ